jgi:hypothetical protein
MYSQIDEGGQTATAAFVATIGISEALQTAQASDFTPE